VSRHGHGYNSATLIYYNRQREVCAMCNAIFIVDATFYNSTMPNLTIEMFGDIYEGWSKGINKGYILSVKETYDKIIEYYKINHIDLRSDEIKWLSQHEKVFQETTNREIEIINEMLQNIAVYDIDSKQTIKQKLKNTNASIIAKAKCVNGIIVTNEFGDEDNINIELIDLCKFYKINYITGKQFYRVLRINLPCGKPLLEGISLNN
jgi:hypothetical protein